MSSYEQIQTTSSGELLLGSGDQYSAALEHIGTGPRPRDLLPDKETKFQVRSRPLPLTLSHLSTRVFCMLRVESKKMAEVLG